MNLKKQTFILIMVVFSLCGCSKLFGPSSYKDLLNYEGANIDLYEMIFYNMYENPDLVAKWSDDLENPNNVKKYKTERAALLFLLSNYSGALAKAMRATGVGVNEQQVKNNYEKNIAEIRKAWEEFVKGLDIDVKKSNVDELTNFFIDMPPWDIPESSNERGFSTPLSGNKLID